MDIVNFLTTNPVGLILLSILSGIVGNCMFSLLKTLFGMIIKKHRHHRLTKKLVEIATAHIYGQRAATIKRGTPAQSSIWVADFIIEYIKHIAIILGLLISLGILLIILPLYLYWIPIIISSIAIVFRYKMMKRLLNFFGMTEDLIFGEQYLKTEKEGYTQYWKSILNDETLRKDETFEDNANQ